MNDYTKLSKAEWVSLARQFYTHLFTELENFSDSEWQSATSYLGWNCKDLLNHMTSAISINFAVLLGLALKGTPVPPPGFNLFLRNAIEIDRRKNDSVAEILENFRSETDWFLSEFDRLSEADWKKPAFFLGDVDVSTLFLVQFADNLIHERDLLEANKRWKSFDPQFADPVLDWFMRALRPSFFKPEKAKGKSATIQYHVSGPGGGNWFYEIKDGACNAFQGILKSPEITVTTTTDYIVSASFARTRPGFGKLARLLARFIKKEKREDFTAKFLGVITVLTSVLLKYVKVTGDRKKAELISKNWFWQYWDRTEQVQTNIQNSRYR